LREIPVINEVLKKAMIVPLESQIDKKEFKAEYNKYFNKIEEYSNEIFKDTDINQLVGEMKDNDSKRSF